jgi:hypothetical protein
MRAQRASNDRSSAPTNVTYSDPFGLCPEEMGGDGKTKGNSDCPKDSKGWNQYRSGAVASGWADPLIFIGGWESRAGEIVAKEVETLAAGAYEVAASGGAHSGFLKNYLGKSASQIERAVGSLEANVADHLGWIENPRAKVADFYSRSVEYQHGLLQKWTKDAVRNQSQANILRRLLEP